MRDSTGKRDAGFHVLAAINALDGVITVGDSQAFADNVDAVCLEHLFGAVESIARVDKDVEGEHTRVQLRLRFALSMYIRGNRDTVKESLRIVVEGGFLKPWTDPPPVYVPEPPYTIQDLLADYANGKFDPNRWNLCIDYNHVNLGETPDEGEKFKFTKCIGFYIMGSGGSQCHRSFYWAVEGPLARTPPMTKERLESWIKRTFKVDRVLFGLG